MSDEVKAAAERTRRIAAGESWDAVYGMALSVEGQQVFIRQDWATLAGAYLAEVPALQADRDRLLVAIGETYFLMLRDEAVQNADFDSAMRFREYKGQVAAAHERLKGGDHA